GRMDHDKNASTFLESLGRIADELEFHALFCGDGVLRTALERRTRELGLESRVTFTGYVGNVFELMNRAGLLVSLSRYEGSPNVVMEAMASGCPLVLSDIASHRELLDDASARFTPLDEISRAASCISDALTDREGSER